ncbi:hypothetical protein [Streptomyces palmae]|uniref:Uncharacterized protein n=1 Tax=Streptomyces palmae TaxID=1701085 RepID=A0A4Z0HB83_9ACTN|nr:hypothetical protein [Streptomyces palmae]TGB14085.1 hypothetical protein E4099_08830 [Streptomyces palmae]
MGLIERLWAAGKMPFHDGLYRPDDTGRVLYADGPGAFHPDAGQPIPFRLGGPLDVVRAVEAGGVNAFDTNVESLLPDGSGWLSAGGGGMGNIGYLARLNADRSLRWVATSFHSNPFVRVQVEGATAVFTNDWRNVLVLDLNDPDLV